MHEPPEVGPNNTEQQPYACARSAGVEVIV